MSNILFIINSLTLGGAERQVVSDANMLVQRGYSITIAITQKGELIKLLDNKITVIDFKQRNSILVSFDIYNLLKRGRYDYVFGHMFWALKLGAIPAYLSRSKFVFFEHGLGLWRKWYHLLLIRFLELKVSAIVVVSNKKLKLKILRERTPKKKLFLIPNSFTYQELGDFCQKPTHQKIVKIVFMGRFNPVKQLHFLPSIAAKISQLTDIQFKFVLCGEGSEDDHINMCIDEQGVRCLFEFPGYVSNPFSILQRSDIFVLPSRIEDFSVALIEAGFAGLPLIAFDVGGNSDIIKSGDNGFLISPFDHDEFAMRLTELLNNPERRKALGKNAHDYISNNYTEEHRLQKLMSLLKSL
jgi:glycosyltransferase involved in cell wall biosynthesis